MVNSQVSSDRLRTIQLGKQLLWAFILSLLIFLYIVGVAILATLTHFLFVWLADVGVDSVLLEVGRSVAIAVEMVTSLLFAFGAIVGEIQAARRRLGSGL